MATPEKTEVQNKIVKRLQEAGAVVLLLQLVGGRGWPDITAFANGKTVLIECKRLNGGRVSQHQWAVSESMHSAGITTYFADHPDIVELALAELGLK